MKQFTIDKKTGFKNNAFAIPIIIRDSRGMLFYETISFNDFNKPVRFFNLPPGTYFIESGNFTPLQNPIQYNLLTLPSKERHYPNPSHFRIVLGNNPNKCSIIWHRKLIVYDKNLFDNSTIPTIFFIYGHEKGHRFYRTEKYADLWSANYMLKLGFNPSQIGISPIASLSDGQKERKKLMVNKLSYHAKRS